MNSKLVEKIRRDERLKIYNALKALGIMNYSIPEDFWFIKIGEGFIGIDEFINRLEESEESNT